MKATASQAVFDVVAKKSLIYGACWEDPALDRQALTIGPDDTMLVITSAGCNVLDYVLCGPKRIHAVDANPRQNALLELRIAGIRHLSYEDFFRIFGDGHHPEFVELYWRHLRDDLTPFARSYWDGRTAWFTGRGWRNSFYLHPLTGWVSLLCSALTAKHRDAIHGLITAESLEAQREIWVRRLSPALWTPQFRWICSQQLFMTAMGVPIRQARELHADYGGPAGYVLSCMDRVIGHLPMRENYFWQLYMRNGSYSKTCCPEYLKREQFEALKAGLVDRISIHTATVAGFLQESDVEISKYVLLDHMDWMDDRTIGREWEQTIRRAAPKARAIFRTVRDRSTMLSGVRVATARRSAGPLLDRLAFNHRLAEELHRSDRVGTYGAFFIADFEGDAAS
jgi:S-adenosylmethionine-diacylglycerol 3-amino-3-carboxypropyl transferase